LVIVLVKGNFSDFCLFKLIEEPSTAEVLSQHLLAAAELAIVHQKQLENFRVWISIAAVQGKPFSPERSRKL
jgi:hypothetical protein